ncbi:hypothetical protein [Streptomyces sp. NPDC015130]|uniref:hypothetical protein n=1 Tax=Streptomyces sp. NPDC015130 TaxID=3364940 RepID=UPI0036FD2E6B
MTESKPTTRLLGQVWTLAEVCQTCPQNIAHITILATGEPALPTPAAPATEPLSRCE